MKTLIELYDERPAENVLSVEAFKPETVVYLCPGGVAQDKNVQKRIVSFLKKRGLETKAVFLETSLFNTEKVKRQMERVRSEYPDCALDITGGTDAALFAGGLFCAEKELPAFTFSWKKKMFYNIYKADFAEGLKCPVKYGIEDFFVMAGGEMKQGRVDNGLLSEYSGIIEPFFEIFMKNRRNWKKFIGYMQKVSQPHGKLRVEAPCSVKLERGVSVTADRVILAELEKIGMIKNLRFEENSSLSFDFRDELCRSWLRDVGAVLEVMTWKYCVDSEKFNEVKTSCVVVWEDGAVQDAVMNELDVVAVEGVTPTFISCKTCAIDTDALNELAILRRRFGGDAARSVIVSTEKCRAITRHRAESLGIEVVDIDNIKALYHPFKH